MNTEHRGQNIGIASPDRHPIRTPTQSTSPDQRAYVITSDHVAVWLAHNVGPNHAAHGFAHSRFANHLANGIYRHQARRPPHCPPVDNVTRRGWGMEPRTAREMA